MKHIDVATYNKIIAKEAGNIDIDFINVCTSPEYHKKHIHGVRSVPLDTLENHVSEFSKKKAIYVHCRSGMRSRQAIERLEKLGVKAKLVNIEGGMLAWKNKGFETTCDS